MMASTVASAEDSDMKFPFQSFIYTEKLGITGAEGDGAGTWEFGRLEPESLLVPLGRRSAQVAPRPVPTAQSISTAAWARRLGVCLEFRSQKSGSPGPSYFLWMWTKEPLPQPQPPPPRSAELPESEASAAVAEPVPAGMDGQLGTGPRIFQYAHIQLGSDKVMSYLLVSDPLL